MNFDKSPFNYIGNKHKLLPQIYTLFPADINIFVDLFVGGGDVCSNITANITTTYK
jgi:site-specific DNA-adenine methylase